MFSEIIRRFTKWGKSSGHALAAVVIGSQARADHPADPSSDLDVLLVTDDPAHLLATSDWLREIGEYRLSFVEDTLGGLKERRVLFDGALDVDIVLLSEADCQRLQDLPEAPALFQRGHRVLFDKTGCTESLSSLALKTEPPALPSEEEFLNDVNDFFYHALWTTKKLRRGETWTALFCLNAYMQRLLVNTIRWHALALHGRDYDIWHGGRFIEEWAEPWIIARFPDCFARYDRRDIENSLRAAMELFRRVAKETAEKLSFSYPEEGDAYASALALSLGREGSHDLHSKPCPARIAFSSKKD